MLSSMFVTGNHRRMPSCPFCLLIGFAALLCVVAAPVFAQTAPMAASTQPPAALTLPPVTTLAPPTAATTPPSAPPPSPVTTTPVPAALSTSAPIAATVASAPPLFAPIPHAPILMIYRAAPDKLGSRDTVSMLIYGDHSGATVHLRLIDSGGRALSSISPVRGSDGDTEPLWSQWISPTITLNYRGWKQWTFPVSQFTYRISPGESASDASSHKLADVDAFGIDFNNVGESIMIDDIVWSSSQATNAPDPIVVDDFETGNFASWQSHGTPETVQAGQLALVLDGGRVKQGRVALSVDFSADKLAKKLALAQIKRLLTGTNTSYVTYVPATPFRRVLPTSMPLPGEIATPVNLFACQGQTESGSFCIYADKDMNDVTVAPTSDLHDLLHSITRDAINIRVVKVWTKAGTGKFRDVDAIGPTPELLMKDDREPLTYAAGAPPQVRLTGDPATSIPAHTVKQFWVTVTVPRDARPGHYNTQLAISGPGIGPGSVSFALEVLPIRLFSPAKQYAIGLRSKTCAAPTSLPSADGSEQVTDYVDPDTLTAQLTDIAGHGFQYATLSDAPADLWNTFNTYKACALRTPLIYSGLTGSTDAEVAAAQELESERTKNGVDELAYIAPPDRLPALYKAKLTTAAFIRTPDEFDQVKDSLDMPIYSVDEQYVQDLVRTAGLRTSDKHDFWFWPAYENDPQANRLYAGYLLFRANLFGAYIPDYQTCACSDPYQVDGDSTVNPAMLTYPVKGGVLDTVQWEAVQAGVNDMRYLTTFYAALRECKDNHVARPLAASFEPQVKQLMSKAFWVLDDSEYQKARRIIAHDSVLLRKELDKFYMKGGGDMLNANAQFSAPMPKPAPKKVVKATSAASAG